jgi:Ni,Fe-hydrogenase maturation factor
MIKSDEVMEFLEPYVLECVEKFGDKETKCAMHVLSIKLYDNDIKEFTEQERRQAKEAIRQIITELEEKGINVRALASEN